jgi:nicotinate phosphoribosyltransferase
MADFDDPGLLRPAEASLLIDRYELAMAASYLRREMDEPAIFELFVRRLPPNRDWLLVAGLGPTLRLIEELRFGEREQEYVARLGFEDAFVEYVGRFRFSGDIDAIPEGTIAFANEPLLRVTATRIEAQLLETLLLNQINFQTMLATKAARVVLAAGGGEPDAAASVIDFSPRRTHGADAAMKVARSSAIAGCGGTSNVAAAMRYGLQPVGTMAHSYVLSFRSEIEAFEAFLRDFPDNTILLVDTYDSLEGVRSAIAASRETGIPLQGIRLDSGDLDALSRQARRLLAELVAADAPIDLWGVGTDLGTSRDSPVVNGVYKLAADLTGPDGGWRGVFKLSPDKATLPGAKQVFRRFDGSEMSGDVIAAADERQEGEPLIVPAMRAGEVVVTESLEVIRARALGQLAALPERLRRTRAGDTAVEPYPVTYSEQLGKLARL